MSDRTLSQELRDRAAEAILIAAVVPEGTKAALQKVANELLTLAKAFDEPAGVATTPEAAMEQSGTALSADD